MFTIATTTATTPVTSPAVAWPVRALARRAKQAWLDLAEFSQERIDAIVDAMANAATPCAEMFARLAVEETGYGVVEDKIQKNLLVTNRTPGPEELTPTAITGDHGLMLLEPAPKTPVME